MDADPNPTSSPLTPVIYDKDFSEISKGANPILDVVFIHGLQGHPKATWTYKESSEGSKMTKSSGVKSIFKGKSKKRDEHTEVSESIQEIFWPLDLLSHDMPNVRILTFGYDSHISKFFKGGANQNSISDHGRALLNALERVRRQEINKRTSPGDPKRPIIFVAHSLGGIILKEALRQAKSHKIERFRSIFDYTESIIFIGTPHRGSSYEALGQFARRAACAAGFDANDRILRDLKFDSQWLKLLRESFQDMVETKQLHFHSFQEAQGFIGTSAFGANRKVVDDESSAVEHSRETVEHIDANHQNMCRFRNEQDDGYIKILGALQDYFTTVKKYKCKEQRGYEGQNVSAHSELTIEQKQLVDKCRKALESATRHRSNQDQAQDAFEDTFQWIWERGSAAKFRDWLDNNDGLYWIRGKPGSGKSTIMKYILSNDHLHTKEPSDPDWGQITAKFFFHDRASAAQKSFRACLCSILLQILDSERMLHEDLWPFLLEMNTEVRNITESDLKGALIALTKTKQFSGRIFVFIDALDESEGTQRSQAEMAKFLNHLAVVGEGLVKYKICVASRDLNVFQDVFVDVTGIFMDQWTHPDIVKYLEGTLGTHPSVTQSGILKDCATRLIQRIVNSAHGVFLWVRLVVEQLEDGLTNGDSPQELDDVLDSLPEDIDALYSRILERVEDKHKQESYVMIEIVRCAIEPISVEDFWFTVQSTMKIQGSLTLEMLHRRLRSRCRGLIEIRQKGKKYEVPKKPGIWDGRYLLPESTKYLWAPIFQNTERDWCVVQFLHQTAKEFANTPERLRVLAQNDNGENGHGWLFKAGVDMMLSACPKFPEVVHFDPANRPRDQSIAISISKVFEYANHAEKTSGISSAEPILKLNYALKKHVHRDWTRSFTLLTQETPVFEAFKFNEWEPPRSLLCLCISAQLPRAVETILSSDSGALSAVDLQLLFYYTGRVGLTERGLQSSTLQNTMFFARLLKSSTMNETRIYPGRSALAHLTEFLRRLDFTDGMSGFLKSLFPSVEPRVEEHHYDYFITFLEILLQRGSTVNEKITYRGTNQQPAHYKDRYQQSLRRSYSEMSVCHSVPLDDPSINSFQKSTLYHYERHLKLQIQQPKHWYRPVHALVRLNSPVVLDLLLVHKCNLHATDSDGRNAAEIAAELHCHRAVSWLRSNGIFAACKSDHQDPHSLEWENGEIASSALTEGVSAIPIKVGKKQQDYQA